jgi:hypothetical protein
VEVEATLEDDWGDLAAPAPGTVETWELERETAAGWERVHATFGPRARWAGPGPVEALPAPGEQAGAWRPAEWSPSRGIFKDTAHLQNLGGSGRVPEEFLDFGRVEAGEAVVLRAAIRCERALTTHLAVGANAVKEAWIDGRPVPLAAPGVGAVAGGGAVAGAYLAAGRVALPAGESVLELRLLAREGADPLRGHFAFVADLAGYARPEWLRAAGEGGVSSVVAFASRVSLPSAASAANVLVGANGPCRVLVDGIEVGRQGGFDPYAEIDKDRLQPYDLADYLRAGEHELRLELLELGRSRPAALLDGLIETGGGTVAVRSGAGWTATRDGREVAIDVRLDQGGGDPAHSHAWRRPHPLPEGAWLEPGREAADPGGDVAVVADATARTERLRLTIPPGALEMRLPLAPGCRATVEATGPGGGRTEAAVGDRTFAAGDDRAAGGSSAAGAGADRGGGGPSAGAAGDRCGGPLVFGLDHGDLRPRACVIEVDAAPGLSGGGVLTGPVAFALGPGRMELVDWQAAGLTSHSGGVRYRRRLNAVAGRVVLDLGEARGTAEVFVDGESAGVRVCSPYRFDLAGRVAKGGLLEVLVLNTLGPHLDAVGPTPHVLPGQRRSGLFGPVRVLSD